MVRFTRGMVFCAALFGGALVARADGTNPIYDSWAKAKVGTAVSFSTVTEASGTKSEIDITSTLKEVTPDAVKIEQATSMVIAGNKTALPVQTISIDKAVKATAAAQAPAGDAPKTDVVKEDVTVDGKTYSCTVLTTNSESAGMKVSAKVWTCPDVPGTVVKSESSTSGTMTSSSKMTLTGVTEGK
jgi:hypothetical protein